MSLLPGLAPNPRGAFGRLILSVDARPKILLALLIGLSLWRLPEAALLPLALAGGWLCFSLGGFARGYLGLWKVGLTFVLVWAGLKLGLDALAGASGEAALRAGVALGLRLTVLLFFGLSLAMSASPRRLGIGLAWFLRPILGARSWQVALSLALMIHFLPLTWAAAAGLLQNLARRRPHCPWSLRLRLIPMALMRVMAQTTWDQAKAVAARRLDRPEAWLPDRPVRPCEWLAVTLPGLVLLLAAL